MQIVIDIPEMIYDSIRNRTEGSGLIECNSKAMADAIYHGTLLPQNHRGIVDLKEVKWAFDDAIMREAQVTGRARATSNEIATILNEVPLIIARREEDNNASSD